jgi:hypothetical protein
MEKRGGSAHPGLLEITTVGWVLVECSPDVTVCSEE